MGNPIEESKFPEARITNPKGTVSLEEYQSLQVSSDRLGILDPITGSFYTKGEVGRMLTDLEYNGKTE